MNLSEHPIPIVDSFVIVAADGRRFVFSCEQIRWPGIRTATPEERKAVLGKAAVELPPA